MWGGRFSEATDAFVAEFTASVQFDQRFYKQDIAGSTQSFQPQFLSEWCLNLQ
jgi:argininosuccinate lyase